MESFEPAVIFLPCFSHNNLNIILFKLYLAIFPKLENESWEWENYKNANLEKNIQSKYRTR